MKSNKFEFTFRIIEIALLILTFVLFFRQNTILDNQTEILKQTSMPNVAALKVKIFENLGEKNDINCYFISNVYAHNRVLQYTIANYGRLPTAPLNFEWNGTNELGIDNLGCDTYIPSIESGQTAQGNLCFTPDKEKLKPGRFTLRLNLRCIFCDREIETFEKEICIYDKNATQECNLPNDIAARCF